MARSSQTEEVAEKGDKSLHLSNAIFTAGPDPQNQPASTGLSQIIKNPESFLLSKIVRGSVGSDLTQSHRPGLRSWCLDSLNIFVGVCTHEGQRSTMGVLSQDTICNG